MNIKKDWPTFLFFFLFFIIFFSLVCKSKEGFGGMNIPSFNQCRKAGYTKEFCSQTPLVLGQPGICQCWDGSLGQILPGFGGNCVCQADFVALNETGRLDLDLVGVDTNPPSPYIFSYSPNFL